MTTQHPRCSDCNHLESLHKYKANYKACTLCNCRIQTRQDRSNDEVDEKDSAGYYRENCE